MSLFDFNYISSEAEQIKFKEQQKSIETALKELSISSKMDQEQEHEKLISILSCQHRETIAGNTINIDMNQFNNHYYYLSNSQSNSPYDPITYSKQLSYGSQTPYSLRERTPSMVSSSSSFFSSSETSSQSETLIYDLTERDDYGFRRSLWIKPSKVIEFERKYNKSKEKQSKRWDKLFSNNDQQWPTLCPQLNRYVQKGIPSKIRSKVWMHYSGAQQKMQSNPGLYQSLLSSATKNDYIELIHKEKHRLFPDNIYFYDAQYENTKLDSLTRVLTAFTYFSPDIGYCKSIGLLAAFILLVIKEEEEAFWLLVILIHHYIPEGMFDNVIIEGARVEQTVFMLMVYEKLPSVWSKIANKRCFWECEGKGEDAMPPVSLLVNHWFSTCFVNALPIETVLRIWDCLLIGGDFTVIHQVALTLLKLNEKRISKAEDAVEVLQFLQSMPKQIIECDEFINCIFSSNNTAIFNISGRDIESKRCLFKNRKIQREMNQSYFYIRNT